MNKKEITLNTISTFFGLLFSSIALINMFWGNDALFGLFLFVLSLIYYPPVPGLIKRLSGFSIPGFAKILLGLFILWASLGVGELFDKIDRMLASF